MLTLAYLPCYSGSLPLLALLLSPMDTLKLFNNGAYKSTNLYIRFAFLFHISKVLCGDSSQHNLKKTF